MAKVFKELLLNGSLDVNFMDTYLCSVPLRIKISALLFILF